jgi:putative transcriptional regulator
LNQIVSIAAADDAMDGLLADYAQGSLPRPLHALVASHVALSPRNRPFVTALEESMALALEEEPCGGVVLRDRTARLNAIFDAPETVETPQPILGDILPSPLAAYVGRPLDSLKWKTKLPGVKEAHIESVDGVEAYFLWVRAGRRMPSHTHDGSEVTLVLKGAFSDTHGRYARGDVAVADSEVDHVPMIDPSSDCICFVVTDAPLRLTGPIGRIFDKLFNR